MTPTPAVQFNSVYKEFESSKGKTFKAVDGVSFDIAKGEITGIIGYSGAGKSTLVRLINGLERPSAGAVLINGEDISAKSESELRPVRADIGMIFQQFNLFNSRTVAANIAFPLKLAGVAKTQRKARVKELLEFVGIADKADKYPQQLSGGQKQRVGIARALATNPAILLADESTSALDPHTTREVLDLLVRINEDLDTTIVVITHEMQIVRSICHKVAVLENGKLVEHGAVYDVFSRPQSVAAKLFVDRTLEDQPDPTTVERYRAAPAAPVIVVHVRDDITAYPRALALFAEHNVSTTLIYGGISEISERPFGNLTLVLGGAEADIDSALTEVGAVIEYTRVDSTGPIAEPAAHVAPTAPDSEDLS